MIKWETESKDIQRKMTEGNKNGPENKRKRKEKGKCRGKGSNRLPRWHRW